MQQVRQWLKEASRVTVLTGAGISAESGVPTFRGPGGLWRQYRPEELATPEAFARDPRLVWEWYDWRRSLIARTQPNPGHCALVELERRSPCFALITQNVDGLHDRAGSRVVHKLHGDIWEVRCTKCSFRERDERAALPELPPRCSCGALLRPGVVWFGEMLPADAWRSSEEAVVEADILLVVGTSAVVYPAAGLVPMARGAGAKVVEVNTEPTPLSARLDCTLLGRAGDILPQLLA